jgi:hypothetical protein
VLLGEAFVGPAKGSSSVRRVVAVEEMSVNYGFLFGRLKGGRCRLMVDVAGGEAAQLVVARCGQRGCKMAGSSSYLGEGKCSENVEKKKRVPLRSIRCLLHQW